MLKTQAKEEICLACTDGRGRSQYGFVGNGISARLAGSLGVKSSQLRSACCGRVAVLLRSGAKVCVDVGVKSLLVRLSWWKEWRVEEQRPQQSIPRISEFANRTKQRKLSKMYFHLQMRKN